MNKNVKINKEKNIQQNKSQNQSKEKPQIKNINSNSNETNQIKINTQDKEGLVINKIYKPNELRELDALDHLKQNIIHYDKNCVDPITEFSYYCFTCKQSFCSKCGLNNHKEHILIQRINCLNYDKTFFNEISRVIEESLSFEEKKISIKNSVTDSINILKNDLDKLKTLKFKEIDNIFIKLKNNLLDLKSNYLKTKKIIENYYETNKNFFNICNEKENITNGSINNDGVNDNIYINNNDISNNNIENNNKIYINEISCKNRDIENTIFILNFDLMNICDNKNLEIYESLNNIKKKINKNIEEINQKTDIMKNEIAHYLDIPLDIGTFEDFYKDINSRALKYSEHINQFKETIYEIIRKTSNLDKIKDLISILESKHKKGNNQIFEQDFFKNPNNIKKSNENIKIRTNSKNKKISRGMSGDFKILVKNINKNNKTYMKIDINSNTSFNNLKKNLMKRDSSKNKKNSISPFRTVGNYKKNKSKNIRKLIQKSSSFFETNDKSDVNSLNTKNIILNQRILQKFFAYSIYGFYSKNYDLIKNKQNKIKLNIKDNNNKSNEELKIANHEKNESSAMIRTVSYMTNYTQRYNKLKEQAKPIIGTNQIYLYDLITKKITKRTVNLTKEVHGYTSFPEGCRHILLENNLYITGGTDMYGMPINIVLLYNLQDNNIIKINNLLENHSYHSLEYLENYDSLILIGGENSSTCEIMDVDTKKWYKLPSLNFPRANVNIYYNSINNDLFALFGINGEISDKKIKYSDIIEVLEMKNISNGWAKVDYYKMSGFNLNNNYCMTLPFNKDKLLIYGAENIRNINKSLFALFDMNKNECKKVDSYTLELIKLEEKKTRLVDMALNKIN